MIIVSPGTLPWKVYRLAQPELPGHERFKLPNFTANK